MTGEAESYVAPAMCFLRTRRWSFNLKAGPLPGQVPNAAQSLMRQEAPGTEDVIALRESILADPQDGFRGLDELAGRVHWRLSFQSTNPGPPDD